MSVFHKKDPFVTITCPIYAFSYIMHNLQNRSPEKYDCWASGPCGNCAFVATWYRDVDNFFEYLGDVH